MSLEEILHALDRKADHQVAAIEETAHAEIEQIRAEAQAKAAAVRQAQLEGIQTALQAEQANILNQAKLEALQVTMGAREELMASALARAAHHLTQLTETTVYADLLRHLAEEAVDTLGVDGELLLRVRHQDVPLMEEIVREMGLAATVEGDLEEGPAPWGNLGGLVAATPDGRVRLTNTLGARLQRVANLHRTQIAEMIWDTVWDNEGKG